MVGHGVAGLLLSAAVGYWVLTLAAKEKGGLRKIGNLVGLLIIIFGLLGAVCKTYYRMTCPPAQCGMKSGGGFCPMTGKGMPPKSP